MWAGKERGIRNEAHVIGEDRKLQQSRRVWAYVGGIKGAVSYTPRPQSQGSQGIIANVPYVR